MSQTELEVILGGTTMEKIILYCQRGNINKIIYQGHQTRKKNILQLKKPISESLYIEGIQNKLFKMFGNNIDIRIKNSNQEDTYKMKKIENIQMTPDNFGGTNVIDGAGFIQNGFYAMTKNEITEMALNQETIPYKMQKKIEEILKQY